MAAKLYRRERTVLRPRPNSLSRTSPYRHGRRKTDAELEVKRCRTRNERTKHAGVSSSGGFVRRQRGPTTAVRGRPRETPPQVPRPPRVPPPSRYRDVEI